MDWTDIKGVRLEVQHVTPPDAQAKLAPLVFLHEGLGSVAMWRDWPARLCAATGRAGLVYSRRGYGQSDPVPDVRGASRVVDGHRLGRLLPDYMHEEAFVVLPALLQALGLQNPVLVGHSDGASIALLHASRFGVAACVAMAPHVVVEDISIQSIAQARVAFETGDLRERLKRYHADVDCAFWQWNDVWLSAAFRSFDIRAQCRRISAPILAIQGLDDPYGTLRQIEAILPASSGLGDENGIFPSYHMDSSLYKLEHCGHSPHRDQTERTTRRIVEFLQSVS